MLNRIPTPGQEGRVLITPEDASIAPFYARMAMADNPTEEGTPLTKETLLQDSTAALYGLGADAVPDDVLKLIQPDVASRAIIETGSYVGTGTCGKDNPVVLNFKATPKMVLIQHSTDSFFGSNSAVSYDPEWVILLHGVTKAYAAVDTDLNGRASICITWEGSTLSFYNDGGQGDPTAVGQLNASGETYFYAAIY